MVPLPYYHNGQLAVQLRLTTGRLLLPHCGPRRGEKANLVFEMFYVVYFSVYLAILSPIL